VRESRCEDSHRELGAQPGSALVACGVRRRATIEWASGAATARLVEVWLVATPATHNNHWWSDAGWKRAKGRRREPSCHTPTPNTRDRPHGANEACSVAARASACLLLVRLPFRFDSHSVHQLNATSLRSLTFTFPLHSRHPSLLLSAPDRSCQASCRLCLPSRGCCTRPLSLLALNMSGRASLPYTASRVYHCGLLLTSLLFSVQLMLTVSLLSAICGMWPAVV